MSVYLAAEYQFDQELKRENVRISFHRDFLCHMHPVDFDCSVPETSGLVMALNEDGNYDLEEMSPDDALERDINYDHFISWREVYELYRNWSWEEHDIPTLKRLKI